MAGPTSPGRGAGRRASQPEVDGAAEAATARAQRPGPDEQLPQQQQQQQQQEQQHDAHGAHEPPRETARAPASPPLPPPPTAAAPGPRAARLRETYALALRRTLARLATWDHFAGCFPTVAARAEPLLRQVQAQMVEKLGDKCEREFDSILVARRVVPGLNELEALVADAADRRASHPPGAPEPTPPHLLPPPQILAAHLAAHLAPHRSLNARLQTTQALNAQLARRLARQRADLDGLVARLDAAAADVAAANRALGALAADLADEARAADAAADDAAPA